MRRRNLFRLLPLLFLVLVCAENPRTEPFSFIVVDDLHFAVAADYDSADGLDERTKRTIRQSEQNFLPFMNELKEQALSFLPKPAALISCGDIVHGGVSDPQAQFRSFFAAYNSVAMPVPLYNALGNHETAGEGMQQAYDESFLPFMSKEAGRQITSRHFSLDFGDSHFILLDSQPPDRRGGDHDKRVFELMDEQWRWLENDLEANRNKEHIFVFGHPTIWPVNGGDVWYVYDPRKQREFVDLLLRYNVRIYFGGHEHVYSVVGYENEAGKKLVQMVPDSEIPLEKKESGPLVRDYTVENVAAGGGSPWSANLQELVNHYRDRIRYCRINRGVAGYYLVSVDGPQVTVKMFEAFSREPLDQYVFTAGKSGETQFSLDQP